MRSLGVIILGSFAAIWAMAGLYYLGEPVWMLVLPAVLSAAIVTWGISQLKGLPERDAAERKRVGRVVGWSSAAEGVLILIAVNVAINLHHRDLVLPVIAAIVGLHFYPMAIGAKTPFYWFTATAMLAIAAGCVWLVPDESLRNGSIGLACAAVLWLSAMAFPVAMRRSIRARAA